MAAFKEDFLARFRWIDGHADMLGLFADAGLLAGAVEVVAAPFRERGITKVAAVEARGFVLGAGVALELGAGFIGIRKSGSIYPGSKAERRTEPDWRGHQHALRVQRAALGPDDLVLLVDDWAETGSQATAARALIEDCAPHTRGCHCSLTSSPTTRARDWRRFRPSSRARSSRRARRRFRSARGQY